MDTLISWLLEGDPAIRWQVQRDLLGSPVETVEAERRRVAEEGWGAQLLALQEPDGRWGGGIYGPKWTSTHYTLLTLRLLGMPGDQPQVRQACAFLLERGFYEDGGINYFTNFSRRTRNYSETCITGMLLNMLAFFRYEDERLDHMAAHLLGQQMPDGGWNCESYRGATHSSVHTTLSVLEGLAAYQGYKGQLSRGMADGEEGLLPAVKLAQQRGQEFLLAHRLFRSHRNGEVFDPVMLRFPFPPRWRYDILRALDYFQGVAAGRDERMQEAMDIVNRKRLEDGRWPQYAGMPGRIYFELEPAGQPGRWNTLRGLRVLKWWEADL